MRRARLTSGVLFVLVIMAIMALGLPAKALGATPEAGFGSAFRTTQSWVSVPQTTPRMTWWAPKDLTIEAWVYPTDSNGGMVYRLPGYWGYMEQYLAVNSNGTVSFALSMQSVGWDWFTTTDKIPVGQWSHIAGVKRGGQALIYINGKQVLAGNLLYAMWSTPNILPHYMFSDGGANPLHGVVDELRVYDAALTTGTVDAWRFRGADPGHPNWASLISYWAFEEGSGTTIADRMHVATGTVTPTGLTEDYSWIPSSIGLEYATDEDTSVSGRLAIYDPDGGALSTTVSSQPGHGVVTMDDPSTGAFTYTPAPDSNGTDNFSYVVSDGTSVSQPARVTVTVRPIPDAPVAGDVGFATPAEMALAVDAPGLLEASSDADGDSITIKTISAPANGSIVAMPDGSFTYTPDADFVGSEALVFTVTDGTLTSGAATATIDVLRQQTTLQLSSGSTTLTAFGGSYVVSGSLEGPAGPRAGERVVLQSSDTDSGFADTSLDATAAADGTFAFTVTPSTRTFYRVAYAGSVTRTPAISDTVSVTPMAWVSTPLAPATAKSGTPFIVLGTLKPLHSAGSGLVRIHYYAKVAGVWTPVGSVDAPVTNNGGASMYSASLVLPSGDWQLRASAPGDAGHAEAWSSDSVSISTRTTEERVVEIARSLIGRKFRWGAKGPIRFDASGFTQYVFAQVGIKLPRTAKSQSVFGPRVAKKSWLRPGDLVFSYSPVRHVGIYIGNGLMIDCNRPGGSVQVRKLYTRYYRSARRPTAK